MSVGLSHQHHSWGQTLLAHSLGVWSVVWAVVLDFVVDIVSKRAVLALLMGEMEIFAPLLHFNQPVFKTLMLHKVITVMLTNGNSSVDHFYIFLLLFLLRCCLEYLSVSILANCILLLLWGFQYLPLAVKEWTGFFLLSVLFLLFFEGLELSGYRHVLHHCVLVRYEKHISIFAAPS